MADFQSIVFDELRHRVRLKLSLGERVVISDVMSAEDKRKISRIAIELGVPISDGDGSPSCLPAPDMLEQHWNGVTIVGDLHGDLKAFQAVSFWARSRRHFMWLLGDILDYGPDTLEIVTSVYHTVMAGEAALILGNHERKIARWLDQRERGKVHLHLSDGNRITTRAFEGLDSLDQQQWMGRFRSLLSHCSLYSVIHDTVLVHAATHPSFWSDKPDHGAIEKFALFGESEHKDGKYRRTHQWIDHVPSDQTVIVGHEIVHTYPLMRTGSRGGQIVFLDTGCGKGGHLSSADLRFSKDGLRLECFKQY